MVTLIAAVGRRGQLGLAGTLPWRDPEDLAWFRRMTMGHVVIVGAKTYRDLPPLPGRMVLVDNTDTAPEKFIALVRSLCSSPDTQIFIAGGEKTYQRYMPFVRRSFITHIDYDGPADAWMPSLWSPE